ncbi:MAG: RNA polymerase sigma factor [Phycisphaerales bacterium]|nr:RNA polymerase sigma factor [Phycisphaerales bacterium]
MRKYAIVLMASAFWKHWRKGMGRWPGGFALESSASTNPGWLSPDAFASRLEESRHALWCIAAAVTQDREQAHDVVQEAAMIALGKLNEFNLGTSFVAWMGQIVRFTALNERRRQVRSRSVATDPSVMGESVAERSVGFAIAGEHASGDVADALSGLDDVARACLLMRTVVDMSYKQIAEALDIPEGTAMSHVHRSRQQLRKVLEARGTGGGV